MPDFSFVGAAYEAPSIYQDDQQLWNWYPELDPKKSAGLKEWNIPGDRGVVALYPTPGLDLLTTLAPAGEVRGLHPLPGGTRMLAVCDSTLYLIDAGFGATAVGMLVSSSGPVNITDNGASAYITDGGNRYYYTWGTDTFAVVTDGPFLGASWCDEVDNYMIYNRPGTRQWGCTNAGSVASGALNLGQKIVASDNLVALIAVNSEVRLFGELTTEVHQDVGAFPFPFQVLKGSSKQHGCVAPFSISRLGEGVAWLAKDTRGQAIVAMTTGYEPLRISTHAIENDICTGVLTDAFAYTYQQEGHEFYVLTLPAQDKTWVYDLATQLWHRRAWRDARGVLHRHRSNCAASFNGQIVVGDFENGNLYAFNRSTYTDNGDAILRRRRCPHVTADLNRVFHHSLQIQFQPGVGLSTGQGSDPKCILRWSDDGGSTWGNDHLLSIGKIGKYKNRAIKRQLGYARDRVYEVDVTDPINAVVVSANLLTSAGAS